MPLVRLVCWNRDLALERAAAIKAAGFQVEASPLVTSSLISQFRALNPVAVVIDLERLPSHGREVGTALRNGKSTRLIPLVFAGGTAEKVARVRQDLPDATYTDWRRIGAAIKLAMRNVPLDPVTPIAHMERYRGTSLVQKLGIKAGMTVALIAPPEGFEETLGEMPERVVLESRITQRSGLVLWFVRSAREVEPAVESLSVRLPEGVSVWLVYPKQAGRYKVDFTQNDVRAAGLAVGLVDYKVCAVDADWTGLKFARKK